MKEPFYLTTAIAYTSGRPHIGNTYEIILSDAIARFKRAQGYDVFFQTGTDEHGIKIEEKAEAAGVTPQEFVDDIAAQIRSNWDLMNTTYDKFIRTTDEDHVRRVQDIFRRFYEQGDIYKGEYEGWYCTPCESFWTESQLVDGNCPDCGRPVVKQKEEAYFFNMKKYEQRLIDYIEEHPEFIQPESRRNEMLNNFLRPGLQDLCVSRTSFKWGIPVDFDPKHVIYVWVDALSNYITSLGYDAQGDSSEMYKKYWPATHIIGKDILRFHTIYWPIFLMALGEPLPRKVFGHPWLLVDNGKMSKSKGNVIYAEDLVDAFGVDAVRYFCLHEMPFAQDGNITWELVIERINSDLANVLGNLVSRTIAMSNKYFDGTVTNPRVYDPVDEGLISTALAAKEKVENRMEELRVTDALDEIFTLLRRTNKYIDETEPWVLARDEANRDRLATVLYNLLESIRISAVLLESFIPETAGKILDMLGTEQRSLDSLNSFGNLETDHKVIRKAPALFARIDEKKFMDELTAREEAKEQSKKTDENPSQPAQSDEAQAAPQPAKPEIVFDDFAKIELRVGTVTASEKVKKSKKLLKNQVDLGTETRQILSGIAQYYSPEDMVGRQVIVVTNLAPRKMAGEVSEGMILCAEQGDRVVLVSPDEKLPAGAVVC